MSRLDAVAAWVMLAPLLAPSSVLADDEAPVCGRDFVSATTLTRSDGGNVADLCRGDTLEILLDENPGTGYRWEWEPPGGGVLDLLDTEYRPRQPARVGAGGERVWRFRAAGTGEVRLALVRRRAWEPAAPVAERFEVLVRVRK